VQALFNGAWLAERSVLVVVNGSPHAVRATLPAAPGTTAYERLWDSADERPSAPGEPVAAGTTTEMAGASLQVWRSNP
jgi:isoamylase